MGYNTMQDENLFEKLDEAVYANLIETRPEWQWLAKAIEKRSLLAEKQLRDVDPTDASTIMQLQQIAKLYSSIKSIIETAKQEGDLVTSEANARGIKLG